MEFNQKHINIKEFSHKTSCGKYARREKGFVLVLALMLISLLSVLAITSFELVISTTRITKNHKDYLKALYTADAGIEHSLSLLSTVDWSSYDWTDPSFQNLALDAIDSSANSSDWNYDSFSESWQMTNDELGDSYTVMITMVVDAIEPDNNKFHIESTGTVSSFTKTIVANIGNIPDPRITLWMEKEM